MYPLTKSPGRVVDGYQGSGKIAPPNSCQPFSRLLIGRYGKPAPTVYVQLKTGLRVGERESRDGLMSRTGLAGGGA
jgi:hypothetical protein